MLTMKALKNTTWKTEILQQNRSSPTTREHGWKKRSVTIYENFYKDEDADTDLDSEPESTIRLFKTRTEVNLVCLMKGEMPQQKDEIAIDRMYADNNDLQVGDVISVDKKELTVTGLVALSDYSALFSNSSDMMFDAVKFGVGIMTKEAV